MLFLLLTTADNWLGFALKPESGSRPGRLTNEDIEALSRLLDMARRLCSGSGADTPSGKSQPDLDFNNFAARYIFKLRRHRNQFLPPSLFAEPAWDMLLMLYMVTNNSTVRAKELALVCDVSFTTALRWQSVLETHNLIERTTHLTDARVTEVRLTDKARQRLDEYFASLRTLQPDDSSTNNIAKSSSFANDQ